MLVYDGANSIDANGPLEVFSTTNRWLQDQGTEPAYTIELIGVAPGTVRTLSGIRLVCDRSYREIGDRIDTLLVAGGNPRALLDDSDLLDWIRGQYRRVRRLGSVCTGSFLLAATGLLDGRSVTTHWAYCDMLSDYCPGAKVERDPLFVRDGKLYTSAGVTAGMDLALALVEDDLGRRVALAVARQMVLFLKRPGGQSQFSAELAAQTIPEGPLRDLPEWIVAHLEEDLSVERLAERVAMSPRNFARVFLRDTGLTPAKYVERARVERARRSLEESTLTVENIATDCGFVSAERMRRTFQRHLRVVPQSYRERFEHSIRQSPD